MKVIDKIMKAAAAKRTNANKHKLGGLPAKKAAKPKYNGAFADDNLGTKLLVIKPGQWKIKRAKNGR